MKKRSRLKKRGSGQFKGYGPSAGNCRGRVVRMQESCGKEGGESLAQDLDTWWQTTAAEGLAHQEEVLRWWSQFCQCCADFDCSSRKVRTLCQRLGSTMLDSADASFRLALKQQGSATRLFQHSLMFSTVLSPGEFQTAMTQCVLEAEGRTRAWGLIPVKSQARAASAWAEFWSLPSSEKGI